MTSDGGTAASDEERATRRYPYSEVNKRGWPSLSYYSLNSAVVDRASVIKPNSLGLASRSALLRGLGHMS